MQDEIEEWRPVVGAEGRYEVSSLGRVKSIARRVRLVAHGTETTRSVPERILKPGLMPTGYWSVVIAPTGTRTVHSLVAEAFLGPRPEGADVAHNDGTRQNNRVSNLRYASRRENNQDRVLHGRTRLTVADVAEVRKLSGPGVPRGAKVSLARKLGVSATTVSEVLYGRSYSHV